MTAYVDTSLLAAYYCPEPVSARAQSEIDLLAVPTISWLVEVELCSAVALKVRTGTLDLAAANRIVSLFEVHRAGNYYQVVTLESREYALARDWIGRFTAPLRALDVLHLACAFANNLTILTTDRGLAKCASVLGVDHRLID